MYGTLKLVTETTIGGTIGGAFKGDPPGDGGANN